MAGSHTPFVFINRAVNPLVGAVLRSPAHGLLSSHLALITVTGRRSGRTFTFRARVRRDDSYPYYLGYSPRVRVRVG